MLVRGSQVDNPLLCGLQSLAGSARANLGLVVLILRLQLRSQNCVTECRSAVHMDCMHWVNRDSYLPQGSRGLKVC